MSFQAYLDNIQKKTGKSPHDFHAEAKARGILGPTLTASRLVGWLKSDFGLGHGHAMAIWTHFKREGWVQGTAEAAKPRTKAKRK
jgi:hypothetical protein